MVFRILVWETQVVPRQEWLRKFVRSNQFLGQKQTCKSFGGKIEVFPFATVLADTPYFSGEVTVTCCVIDDPVIDLILGSLPGVSSAIPGLGGSIAPTCVSTRAQVRQQQTTSKPLQKIPLTSLLKNSHIYKKLIHLSRSALSKQTPTQVMTLSSFSSGTLSCTEAFLNRQKILNK